MDFQDYTPYLTINGVSKHSEDSAFPNKKWNEKNQGYGLELKKAQGNAVRTLIAGQYNNSLNNLSNYIAYMMQKRLGNENLHADFGVTLGGVTGYDLPVTPMVQPTLSVGGKNFDTNLRYQPRIEGYTPEVWSLNSSYRLGK